ncbi:hypothetical protein [Massilia sp. 9096]|uniref:hypothetical protein n=1 Tax=Massilia sp. 9096 TaxID=1500894 RepID=UPI00068FE47F|nr:hypothetical protein [Massilia sp. 9096]
MKRLSATLPCLALLPLLLLSGCAGIHSLMPADPATRAQASAPARAPEPALRTADGAPIEKLPFHTGVSSATVERMAREQACQGGLGAGLVTPPGPVEVYRMQCDNGKTFMARCELRQCRGM